VLRQRFRVLALVHRQALVTLMTDMKFLANNCKPRSVDFIKARMDELRGSLDEQLDPAPFQRKMSYNQALHMIKQFTFLIKDCNYLIEPEN